MVHSAPITEHISTAQGIDNRRIKARIVVAETRKSSPARLLFRRSSLLPRIGLGGRGVELGSSLILVRFQNMSRAMCCGNPAIR